MTDTHIRLYMHLTDVHLISVTNASTNDKCLTQVFAVLWPEISGNGGGNGSKRSQSEPTDCVATGNTRCGETVFSHIRHMVVVKEDHGFCLCL
jgi:hypothetical protein